MGYYLLIGTDNIYSLSIPTPYFHVMQTVGGQLCGTDKYGTMTATA